MLLTQSETLQPKIMTIDADRLKKARLYSNQSLRNNLDDELPVKIINGDITAGLFPPESFDLITSNAVLEHITPPIL